MESSKGFNLKKTLFTAAVGAGVLAGAGLLAYLAFEDKMKEKHRKPISSSDLTLSDLSLRPSKSHNEDLRSSTNSFITCRSKAYCSEGSEISEYETTRDMFSIRDDADDFNDLTFEEEIVANESNLKSNILARNFESELFEKVDLLMKGKDSDRLNAFIILKNHEMKLTENAEFLWRYAKAHEIQAFKFGSQNNLEMKKKFVLEGLEFASKAVAMDSANPNAHKWFAVLTGMRIDFVSMKDKVDVAKLFYEHLLTALKLKESDYFLHYLLARFIYEVASASWVQKKIMSSLFPDISFTYSDAIVHLLKSEELSVAPCKHTKLLLAKCYIGDGEYFKAKEWLHLAKDINCQNREDETIHQEVQDLIVKYQDIKN